ncbi:MAG: permease prefix domain 1-containing protein [Anaerovoracaceae bacterium]
METILNYLESMFAQLPQTGEVLKAKKEMLAMMEDKYQELKDNGKSENEAVGTVISEFGNIEELTRELGIEDKSTENNTVIEPIRKVSIKEGKEFIDEQRFLSVRIAIAVVMCILSPVILLVLGGISEDQKWLMIDEGFAMTVGCIVMFLLVAPAVGLFIVYGMKLEKYKYLHEEVFVLEDGAKAVFESMKKEETSIFGTRIAVGVILCILSVIPILVIGFMFEGIGSLEGLSVGVLLIIVAVAVYIFITAGMPYSGYDVLLQKGDYDIKKKDNKTFEGISTIYWCLIVAIYLAYSFITSDWGRSWIVWPVAGVIFGAIAALYNITKKK